MKKILSILLAVLLMSSCVMTVSAADAEQSGNMTVTATVEDVSYTFQIPSDQTFDENGCAYYNGPMILNAKGINGVTKYIQISTEFGGKLIGTNNTDNILDYMVMPHDDQPGDAWEIEQNDFVNGMESGQVFYWYPLTVTNADTGEEEITAHPLYQSEYTASLPKGIAIISTTSIEIDQEQWAAAEPDTYTDTFTFSASVVTGKCPITEATE